MIPSLYAVNLLSRDLTQKLTCIINTVKYHIKWDNISDDNLDELAIEIWADILSGILSFC